MKNDVYVVYGLFGPHDPLCYSDESMEVLAVCASEDATNQHMCYAFNRLIDCHFDVGR